MPLSRKEKEDEDDGYDKQGLSHRTLLVSGPWILVHGLSSIVKGNSPNKHCLVDWATRSVGINLFGGCYPSVGR